MSLLDKLKASGNKPEGGITIATTDPDAVLPLRVMVPLGLQHVLAMFAGNVTIPIIIAGVVSATTHQTTMLIQAAILVAGLATLVQTIGIGPFGAKLPVVQGTGFAMAAVAIPLASQYGLSAVFGGAIAAAVAQVIVGYFIKYFRWLFQPIVMGIVLTSVGLGLLPVGISLAAGGVGSDDFGSASNWLLAGLVLAIALCLNMFGKGMFAAASVLISLVIGYIVAIPMNKVDFQAISDASYVSIVKPFAFGISFPAGAIIAMVFVGVVTLLDSIGTVAAVTKGGADREPTEKEISGAVMADGIGSALGGIFGTVPNTTYTQNAGLIVVTKSMSRHVVTCGAVILVLLSLFPKASAVFASMPPAVLGGASLMLFGTVLVVGIQMIGEAIPDQRTFLNVAVALTVGQGFALVPETVAGAPELIRVLLENGVVTSTIIMLVLNFIFGRKKDASDDAEKNEEKVESVDAATTE